MGAPSTKSAQQLLDEVYRLSQLEGFDEAGYLEQLGAAVDEEDPEDVEARTARVNEALAGIDAFASRVMGIRLDHLLATDNSVPRQFRRYLAAQVLDYEGRLGVLRDRVAEAVARTDPGNAVATSAAVAQAADQVLGLRARLRQGALAMLPPEPQEEPEAEPRTPDFFELIELD